MMVSAPADFDPDVPDWNTGFATNPDENVLIAHAWEEMRTLMWNYVGIVRSNKRLERAKRRAELLNQEIKEDYWNFTLSRDLLELRNIARVGQLIIESAMMRKESRGLHYTVDYPQHDDAIGRRDTILRKGKRR